MAIVKSFSVGNGDMFYIIHNSDNFSMIDCCLDDKNDNKDEYIKDILSAKNSKGMSRFISTHPDEDHIKGIKELDEFVGIDNFYCVKNEAIKNGKESESFKYYCTLRDGKKAFYVQTGCTRKWLNQGDDKRGSAGINFLWPEIKNSDYIAALKKVKQGTGFNQISPIFTYSVESGFRVMWLGDMEDVFLSKIKDIVAWKKVDVLFAPHHGRDSAKIPAEVLKKIDPYVIVIGEAPSEDLNYYTGYNTIKQNSAGTIVFENDDNDVHIYLEKSSYSYDLSFLKNLYRSNRLGCYVGSFKVTDK